MAVNGIFSPTEVCTGMAMRPARIAILTLLMSVLTACATTVEPATVIRTLYNPEQPGFARFLVISVAGDYATRASLERQLAAAMTNSRSTASPYYTIIGRNPQVTRAFINDAIVVRGFDAVMLVRQQGQEQESVAPGRPIGNSLDLFRYDYPEFNRDLQIREAQAITFVTEVYDASSQLKVWGINTLSTNVENIDDLLTEQVFTIAQKLDEDGLLDP